MKRENSTYAKGVRNAVVLVLTALLVYPFAAAAEKQAEFIKAGSSVERPRQGGAGVEVGVLYLTNRRRQVNVSAAKTYGGERGEVQFGRCQVEFTPIPIVDKVTRELPFYLPSETNRVRLAEQLHAREFWDGLTEALEQTSSGSLVVFVHGYNYDFERTCRMTAEMQRGLRGEVGVLMFSWPSKGLPGAYVHDQASLEWSVPLLARFIGQLGQRIGPDKVQVLAHSLGSRGILFALQRLAADQDARPLIGRLVLLAPDFDSQTFVELLPRLASLTGGITLYASSQDTPLKVSRQLSGHPRLGEAGEYLTLAEGMETVDVSPAGRYQIWGHEYFYFHPLVAADLAALLGTGASAADRVGLRPNRRDGIQYWEIRRGSSP